MNTCQFCGSTLASQATFCAACGESQPQPEATVLIDNDHSGTLMSDANRVTQISKSRDQADSATQNMSQLEGAHDDIATRHTSLLEDRSVAEQETLLLSNPEDIEKEKDEEEHKRGLALLGLAVLGEALSSGDAATVPVVPGPLQINQAPIVQGMPQIGQPSTGSSLIGPDGGTPAASHNFPAAGHNFPSSGTSSSPSAPSGPQQLPSGNTPTSGPSGSPPSGPPASPQPIPPVVKNNPPPQNLPPGCVTWALVILIPILILTGFLTAGYTIFAPTLTLNGASNVAAGSSFLLNGSGFLSHTTIALTLDNNTPLYVINHPSPTQARNLELNAASLFGRLDMLAHNTLSTDGNGKFTVNIAVGPGWKLGRHVIHATETTSMRTATTTFNVTTTSPTPGTTPGATDTPIATTTPTPGPTDTPTVPPGVTPTATLQPGITPAPGVTPTTPPPPPAQSALSSVSPGDISLGSVLEGSGRSTSGTATLNTTGSATVSWTASWNASWLHLSSSADQIQAPNSQQITLTASSNGLSADTYNTTVTFSGGGSTVSLNVSFTVQATCLNTSTTSLSFRGVAYTSDPGTQTVSLDNCGLSTNWTSSVSTASGGNWLSISPASDNLRGGSSEGLTVKAINRTTELKPGTYTGTIVITSGSRQITINVTFTVSPPPVAAILTVTPTQFINAGGCQYDPNTGNYACIVSLSSNGNASSNLNWSVSSNHSGITYSQSNGTLAPGGTQRVVIYVPSSFCGNQITITFQGPSNAQQVSWSCTIIG